MSVDVTSEVSTTTTTTHVANDNNLANSMSVWPRRLAVTLVVLVWPLIWVGGLVTTYDAGMSVPDWPGTYGYNLFLYPLSTWLLGPFDLFIEHGHRLLGALVGFVAIGFLIATWKSEPRRWVTWLAVAVLLAVIGQGVLGGLRVTMSARVLAMVHGCTGPVFFALCVVAACVTGRNWKRDRVLGAASADGSNQLQTKSPWSFWPIALIVLAYMQLVLGAILRHALPSMSSSGFAHTVTTHVSVALLLWGMTAVVYWRMSRCGDLTLSRPASGLICFVGVQIALGIGTWVVNYGYPTVLQSWPGADSYLLKSKDLIDAWVVTGHVATGSLILAVSTLLAVRLFRRKMVLSHV
jgi:cytochrome c oxidase assembly protein subunit 15